MLYSMRDTAGPYSTVCVCKLQLLTMVTSRVPLKKILRLCDGVNNLLVFFQSVSRPGVAEETPFEGLSKTVLRSPKWPEEVLGNTPEHTDLF